jgi:hypothetical protein
VDKASPEKKKESEKKLSTIELRPHHPQDIELFWKIPQ